MDAKRVFVLGAGASIGHSRGVFPSITGFFKAAKDLELDVSALKNYAKRTLGLKQPVDIENLFTHIEIERERKPSVRPMVRRERILNLIRDVLIGLQAKASRRGQYHKLVKKLSSVGHDGKVTWKKDTVISFNWDLLLDNAFDRESILQERYNTGKGDLTNHYGRFLLDLAAIGEGVMGRASLKPPYADWSPNTGFYLKMHGSVDWFYCPNQGCRAAHKVFPMLEPTRNHYCLECHEPVEALLVPPALNKQYRQYPIIRRLWNLAAKEMGIVNHLVIWGYGLPATDFYSLWLLRQARIAALQSLTLINPAIFKEVHRRGKKSWQFNRDLVTRFYDIFRDKLDKDFLTMYADFDDYCKHLDIFSKLGLEDSKIIHYNKI